MLGAWGGAVHSRGAVFASPRMLLWLGALLSLSWAVFLRFQASHGWLDAWLGWARWSCSAPLPPGTMCVVRIPQPSCSCAQTVLDCTDLQRER
jgi:hypothetical protein